MVLPTTWEQEQNQVGEQIGQGLAQLLSERGWRIGGIEHGIRHIEHSQGDIMGRLDVIQQALEAASATAAEEAAQVTAHVQRLADQIASLQDSIDALVAAQVTQEEIDALAAQAAGLSDTVEAIDTEGEGAPVEEPPVEEPPVEEPIV
jgi:chemotaxis regulatin CheY-phosphate phosphatase CheZ